MIYGFINDNCFQDLNSDTFDVTEAPLPCGFLPPELFEYYQQQVLIKDIRDSRLPIDYREIGIGNFINDQYSYPRDTLISLLDDLYENLVQEPDLTVGVEQYDAIVNTNNQANDDHIPDGTVPMTISTMSITFDKVGNETQYTNWKDKHISTDDKKKIFNIIEYLVYGTIPTDSINDINTFLNNNTATFGTYKDNSATLSDTRTIVYIYDAFVDDTVSPPVHGFYRFIPNWIQFSYTYIDEFDNSEKTIDFKLWISRLDFEINYPISRIIDVIPPLPLDQLQNPGEVTGIYQALEESALLTVDKLAAKLHIDDYSGFVGLTLPYVISYNNINANYDLTFGVLYKGKIPTSAEIRTYIRTVLFNNQDTIWRTKFPTLYVDHSFFFIPLYSNRVDMGNGTIVYPSITEVDFNSKLHTLLDGIVNIDTVPVEIFTVTYQTMSILAVSGDNVEPMVKLLDILQSYRNYNTIDPKFNTLSPDEQEFAVKVNDLLSQCMNENNDEEFYHNVYNENEYYSFVQSIAGKSYEFIMITENSYNNVIN